MAEAVEFTHYLSNFYKRRTVPAEVARRETQARRDFLQTFIPELHGHFQKRGVEVLIDVIGSVAAGAAIETSDIDLLVREAETDDLERVRGVGFEVRVKDLREQELPYQIEFWFDHPYGSEAYRRLIEWEAAHPLSYIVNNPPRFARI